MLLRLYSAQAFVQALTLFGIEHPGSSAFGRVMRRRRSDIRPWMTIIAIDKVFTSRRCLRRTRVSAGRRSLSAAFVLSFHWVIGGSRTRPRNVRTHPPGLAGARLGLSHSIRRRLTAGGAPRRCRMGAAEETTRRGEGARVSFFVGYGNCCAGCLAGPLLPPSIGARRAQAGRRGASRGPRCWAASRRAGRTQPPSTSSRPLAGRSR
jgi:hypothetical protein